VTLLMNKILVTIPTLINTIDIDGVQGRYVKIQRMRQVIRM